MEKCRAVLGRVNPIDSGTTVYHNPLFIGASWSLLGHFLAAFLMALSWQGMAAISLGLLESAASRSFSEEMMPRCKGLRGESAEEPTGDWQT